MTETSPTPEETTKAILYRRVSTSAQAESGLGMGAQLHLATQWAKANNAEIVAQFEDDGVSSGLPLQKRLGLMAALDALNPGMILLVAKRTRLFRSVEDAVTVNAIVRKKRARIISASGEGTDRDDASGVFMSHVLDAASQFERDQIRQRTSAALGELRRQGRRFGHIPFGLKLAEDKKHLAFCEDELVAVTAAHELRKEMSWKGVCDGLNEKHILNREGAPWTVSAVFRVFKIRLEPEGKYTALINAVSQGDIVGYLELIKPEKKARL